MADIAPNLLTTLEGLALPDWFMVWDTSANALKKIAPWNMGLEVPVMPTGVAATDTANVQAALNIASSLGSASIFVGPGTLLLSTKLTMYSKTRLRGSGKGVTILKIANGANINMFENADPTNGNVDITIQDMTCDGNKANQGGGGRGFFMRKVTRGTLLNVDMFNFRNRAIHCQNGVQGYASNVAGRDCGVFQEQVFTHDNCDGCVYDSMWASGGTDRDFEIAFCRNVQMHHCLSISPVGAGLGIYSTTTDVNDGIIVDGFVCLNPQAEIIYLERVKNSHFSNLFAVNPGTEGIRDYGDLSFMEDNSFENVYIYNPGASGITTSTKRVKMNNINIFNAAGHGIRVTQADARISNSMVNGAGQNCYWIGPGADHAGIMNCIGKNGGKSAVGGHRNGVRLEGIGCQIIGGSFYDDQATKTQDYGIREIAPGDFNSVLGVDLRNNSAPALKAGANSQFRNNQGYISEASGTATVASGAVTIVVTHGLSATPALKDIMVTPTNSLGLAAKYWISNVTATQFTINVNVDPGATTATFVWKAGIL